MMRRLTGGIVPLLAFFLVGIASPPEAEASSVFVPDAGLLLGESTFVGLVSVESREKVFAGESHCGFVYDVVVEEALRGDVRAEDEVAIFAGLDQDFEDFSVDYLVVVMTWPKFEPVGEEGFELTSPIGDPKEIIEGEGFDCRSTRADFYLSPSELQLALPLQEWPSKTFDGLWLWQERESVLSNVDFVRSVSVGDKRAFHWGDVRERLRDERHSDRGN